MAERVTFRDPETGRFISRAIAEEIGGTAEILDLGSGSRRVIDAFEFFEPADAGDFEPEPRWSESDDDDGIVWSDFEPSVADLSDFEPPEDADAFRVFFDVPESDEYPRRMASTFWMGMESWPPSLDMLANASPTGFNQIRFRRA